MSIAIAETLIAKQLWTKEVLADSFVIAFQRDPREGYASGFYHFLCQVEDGAQFLAIIKPDSDKSGAAMRAAPIGILPTVKAVMQASMTQAVITHNTPDGINAAIAASLMSHYFIYQLGAKRQLREFLETLTENGFIPFVYRGCRYGCGDRSGGGFL
jgi:ADP-ribosylglycohydrolase